MPDWDAIAKKQRKVYRNMYSHVDLERDEYYQKIATEREKFKTLMVALLKEDEEFRKEVVELLKQ